METYSAARVPHRKVFTNLNDMELDLNKWKNSNISISVWWYKEIEQKYEGVGIARHSTRIGPKYSTAITDKLFFDIDCMRKDGSIIRERVEDAKTLWRWARKANYKREVAFTSGGYQILIGAKVRPENYSDTVHYVENLLNIEVDPAISLTDMRRVAGSFNYGDPGHVNGKGEVVGFKSTRNTYCISLTDDEMELPWYKHVRLSFTQRTKVYRYGSAQFSTSQVFVQRNKRKLDHRSDFNINSDLEDIFDKYGYDYETICPNIRAIIEKPHVEHMERIMIIKYLKDIVCMKYADVVLLLPKLLTADHGMSNDGAHSVEEGQVSTVFSRGLVFQPDKMKQDGYCDSICSICQIFMEAIRKL